ncbi:MAG: hypothetical protein DIJKHBIC_04718 [Thermoanaerobaculia bacterium]|nr:hypothetical protein [Thermoanaerobaculia bacterium]
MAHFLKPDGAPPAAYTTDNSKAPGFVVKVMVPLNGTLEVALWGGAGLKVTSKNNTVVPTDRITERQSGDLRVLSLFGASAGSTMLETGGSVTLQVGVGIGVAPIGDAQVVLMDGICRATVLAVLADPAVNKIDLKIDRYAINFLHYGMVRKEISSGKIAVRFNPNLTSQTTGFPYAYYHAPTNALNCGFATAPNAAYQGLIVHEATHVACDVSGYSAMSTVTSEVLGYLAQAIFMLEKSPGALLQMDPITSSAQILAEKIQGGAELKSTDLIGLKNAILSSSQYRDKAQKPGYDGVG